MIGARCWRRVCSVFNSPTRVLAQLVVVEIEPSSQSLAKMVHSPQRESFSHLACPSTYVATKPSLCRLATTPGQRNCLSAGGRGEGFQQSDWFSAQISSYRCPSKIAIVPAGSSICASAMLSLFQLLVKEQNLPSVLLSGAS